MDHLDDSPDRRSTRVFEALRRLRCPGASSIAAHVDGRLSGTANRRLSAHLENCPECASTARHLSEMADAGLPEVPPTLLRQAKALGTRARKSGGWNPAWRFAGSLAAAGLLLTLGIRIAPSIVGEAARRTEDPRAVRGTGDPAAAPAIVAPEQGAVATGEGLRLEWTAVPDAVSYEVHLLDAEGSLVESFSSTDAVPASPRSKLEPGVYFVSVEATLPDGRSLRGSFSRFEVRASR